GAQAREEPDRGRVRVPGRLDLSPGLAAGAVRAAGRVREEGRFPPEHARPHRRRSAARGQELVPARSEERGHPAAEAMKINATLAVLVLLLTASAAIGAPAGAPPGAPAVHREVLPNGIVLLVAERPAIPIVAVRVYMLAGAVQEPPEQAGLANLTGALLARGTAKP